VCDTCCHLAIITKTVVSSSNVEPGCAGSCLPAGLEALQAEAASRLARRRSLDRFGRQAVSWRWVVGDEARAPCWAADRAPAPPRPAAGVTAAAALGVVRGRPTADAAGAALRHGVLVGGATAEAAGAGWTACVELLGRAERRVLPAPRATASFARRFATELWTGHPSNHTVFIRSLFIPGIFFFGGGRIHPPKKLTISPPPNGCQTVCSKFYHTDVNI